MVNRNYPRIMSKATYKISNWPAYNRSLRERGSLSVWISERAIEQWEYDGPAQRGGQRVYSEVAIRTCLSLRLVFGLPLRQTQGFTQSLFEVIDLDLPVPDYSTLSRRQPTVSIDLARGSLPTSRGAHILIDSTGLKVYGESEWKQRTHGKSKRRTWRKLHLSVDRETGQITGCQLTGNSADDGSQVASLLEETLELLGSIARVGADGAYDKWKCYEEIDAVGAQPVIPPRKDAKIKKHGNCKGPPLPRDEAIRYIRAHGRKKWKTDDDYHVRSLVEATIRRFKTLIERVLRSRRLNSQRVEARLASNVLNQMTRLGMPESYKVTTG